MHISRLTIENFRCIRALELELGPTSVIIGENNAGKTAVLDAIKIALGRRWGRAGQTGFTEYDFTFAGAGQPRPPIKIGLLFAETDDTAWPQAITDDLTGIVRTNPVTGLNSIHLQVRCTFEDVTGSVEPVWEFLNEDEEPYAGAGARNQNLSRF